MTTTRRGDGRRSTTRLAATLLTAALTLGAAAVSQDAVAARAPLTSRDLLGRSFRTGAITATFSHPAGTSLATTSDTCPSPWTVTGGTMAVTSGQALASTTSALVTATVPLCDALSVGAEAGGDVRRSGGATAMGVIVHADADGRPATAAVYYSDVSSGTVQLRRISSTGTLTTWAQVSNLGSIDAPRHLRLVYVDGVYRVHFAGTSVLSYAVPDAATRTTVEAFRQVGIVASSDTRTLFDNFQAYPR